MVPLLVLRTDSVSREPLIIARMAPVGRAVGKQGRGPLGVGPSGGGCVPRVAPCPMRLELIGGVVPDQTPIGFSDAAVPLSWTLVTHQTNSGTLVAPSNSKSIVRESGQSANNNDLLGDGA